MTTPEPSIRINVDPTNPGQFFACCGLLELADRMWPGAEGWFADNSFRIACRGTLPALLHALVAQEPKELTTLDNNLSVKPLIAPLRLSIDGEKPFLYTLDAWMTVRLEKGKAVTVANPPWNFWSGQQTSLRIWLALRMALSGQLRTIPLEQYDNLFSFRVFLSGRFGFDPGGVWNALDVGFSPNEQKMEVASSAAIELLAAVGIQRFRPEMADDRQTFLYATWCIPLAPSVAAVASSGRITDPASRRFQGRVISRSSYAALGQSISCRGRIS